MHRLVKKVLYVGFFAFVIGNFSALAGIVFDSFAGLGLKASGASISIADFMKPGSVAATGFDAGEPLMDAMGALLGFRSFFANRSESCRVGTACVRTGRSRWAEFL